LSDSVPIKIQVDTAEIDEAIAKLDSLEPKTNTSGNFGPLYEEVRNMPTSTSKGDEYAGYAEMRARQRETMFPEEEGSEGSFRTGRLIYAGYDIAQGRLPTQTLLRSVLSAAGLAGPEAIVAMLGIESIIKVIVALQTEATVNAAIEKYEINRQQNFIVAQRGVMTE